MDGRRCVVLTDEQRSEIIARYAVGDPVAKIAAAFGISGSRVSAIAIRAGYRRRGPWPRLTGEQQSEIVARYAAGEPVADIAAAFGVSEPRVSVIANAAGRRRQRPWRKLTPEQVEQILARYAAGDSVRDISREIGVTSTVISRTAEKHGLPRRYAVKRSRRPRLTDEERADIIRRYCAGERIASIAASYGITDTFVSNIANAAGYRRRPRRNESDATS